MNHTAIRHTMSALAAVALVSVFANSPVSAQPTPQLMSNIAKSRPRRKIASRGTQADL